MGKLHIVKRAAALLLLMLLFAGMLVPATHAFVRAQTAQVVNRFMPQEIALSDLVVSKKLEHPLGAGYKIPDNITFDFEVALGSYYSEYVFETTDGGTVTADKRGVLSLNLRPGQAIGIEGIDAGTVATVRELPTDLPGFSVKDGISTTTATVNTEHAAIAEITNVYKPKKADNCITLQGTKSLVGREWKEGDSFTVRLEMLDGEQWKTLGDRVIRYDAKNPDFAQFDFTDLLNAISFKRAGKYQFRLSELKGTDAGLAYDQTVHTLTALVGDETMDGQLEIQSIEVSDGVEARYDAAQDRFLVEAGFTNTYQPAEDISVSVTVNKVVKVTGVGAMAPSDFTFVLRNEGDGSEHKAITDAEGLASFDLIFTDADAGKTFTYTLFEYNDGKEHVTYSDVVYELVIEVYHNEAHQLEALITQNGMSVDEVVAEFENIYHYEPPAEPDPPADPEPPAKPEPGDPDTGDHRNDHLVLWVMIISGIALILAVAVGLISRKRKSK